MLVWISGRNMLLFEERCQAHGVELSFANVLLQFLSKSSTFKLLEAYIDKTHGLEELISVQESYEIREDHPAEENLKKCANRAIAFR